MNVSEFYMNVSEFSREIKRPKDKRYHVVKRRE